MAIVYKNTNGMLHDVTYKNIDEMDVDDFILEGWDRVPSMEELSTLHDQSYQDQVAAEALAITQRNEAIKTEILANLPSQVAIENAINNITNLAEAKEILKKFGKFLRWMVEDIYKEQING